MDDQPASEQQQGDGVGIVSDSDRPGSDWKQVGKIVWKESGKDHVSILASGIAFNAFLAFIPFLTSVVLTYGLVAAPQQVAGHIDYLSQVMPGQAADLIGNQLRNMVETASSTTGLGLLVTLGLSLYGALRGAGGIISGLNIIFDVEESRSFLQQTLVGIAVTLGLILAFILASAGITILGFLSAILPDLGGLVHDLLRIGFWVAAAAVVSMVVSVIYRLAPNRGDLEWRWLTPGSVLATGTWLVATYAFGLYVQNFGSYQAVYGALGTIIIFLIWLYISAYILLLGAELNQVLMNRRGKN
ncbi:MAG TPA: YihY/virulence factor BrkB family protein [Sphingomicrobium sp.]|nr:YihY/virulence factor BrkB family protein [Sphingomicrobium sp.]